LNLPTCEDNLLVCNIKELRIIHVFKAVSG